MDFLKYYGLDIVCNLLGFVSYVFVSKGRFKGYVLNLGANTAGILLGIIMGSAITIVVNAAFLFINSRIVFKRMTFSETKRMLIYYYYRTFKVRPTRRRSTKPRKTFICHSRLF